jgi:hypothetical protein
MLVCCFKPILYVSDGVGCDLVSRMYLSSKLHQTRSIVEQLVD